jgi:hypothetical protein
MGGGQLAVIEMIIKEVKKQRHGLSGPGTVAIFRSQWQPLGRMPLYPMND